MTKPRLVSLLLLSTAMAMPSVAWAQDSNAQNADASAQDADQYSDENDAPEVSLPGGEIVVTGQRNRNIRQFI